MTFLTVEHLQAGWCTAPGALAQRGQSWRRRRFPAGVALLHHPEHGLTLFDSGYSRAALKALKRWPARLYGAVLPVTLPAGQTIAEQLTARGQDPGEIERIICSHLHLDHLAGAADFPSAPVWLDPADLDELTQLRGWRALRRGIVPGTVPDRTRLRALTYTDAPEELHPFPRAADFFGDQSLWIVPAPGHTAGSVAAIARTGHGEHGAGLQLLAGDVAWSESALRTGIEPHRLAQRVANHDAAQASQTAARWRQWLAAHPRARVVVSHDAPT